MNLAEKDAAYRQALGVPDGEPLPNAIGQVSGHARDLAHEPRYYEPTAPAGADLGACDMALRRRRRAITARAIPRGDVDAQLDEFAEAIEHAELARDTARTRRDRLAAGAYVVRLKDRRDALIRTAGAVS